jgi:hypothetical protein
MEGFTSHIEAKHPYNLPEPENLEYFLEDRFSDFLAPGKLPLQDVKACVLIGRCDSTEESYLRAALEKLNRQDEYVRKNILFIFVCETVASLE